MAGWLAGRRNAGVEIVKFLIDQIFQLFAVFNKVTALLEQYECIFKLVFSAKACFKVVIRNIKNWEATVFLVNSFY